MSNGDISAPLVAIYENSERGILYRCDPDKNANCKANICFANHDTPFMYPECCSQCSKFKYATDDAQEAAKQCLNSEYIKE